MTLTNINFISRSNYTIFVHHLRNKIEIILKRTLKKGGGKKHDIVRTTTKNIEFLLFCFGYYKKKDFKEY